MIGWLKKRVAERKTAKTVQRFKQHFSKAAGIQLERILIAAAMVEIEDPMIQEERVKVPVAQQETFMMAYECFVMWTLKRGIAVVLEASAVSAAVLAMRNHFAKHACYSRGAFEKIWAEMERLMPQAMIPSGGLGIVYPAAEICEAARQAGFQLD